VILRFLYYEVLLFLILRLVFEIMFKFTYILFLVFDLGLGFDFTFNVLYLLYYSCYF